ncbi:unnamed protein product [Nezara viridula]|uniref:Uncharacterized protein n=1 Tax=Nezara viridula TaxID=85310 RepID=A0A9P0HJ26_NEZVI|nr:unnamed protein product [Nezara viridula]
MSIVDTILEFLLLKERIGRSLGIIHEDSGDGEDEASKDRFDLNNWLDEELKTVSKQMVKNGCTRMLQARKFVLCRERALTVCRTVNLRLILEPGELPDVSTITGSVSEREWMAFTHIYGKRDKIGSYPNDTANRVPRGGFSWRFGFWGKNYQLPLWTTRRLMARKMSHASIKSTILFCGSRNLSEFYAFYCPGLNGSGGLCSSNDL